MDENKEEVQKDVSKVFGNENQEEQSNEETKVDPMTEEQQENVDSKQEGASSASNEEKQSKESKKTYTQEEVDAMMAKARKKYQGKGTDNEQVQTEEVKDSTLVTHDLATGIPVERLAQAELKAMMAINGVSPEKVARAVRLVDINEVLENGQYSETKAKESIEQLIQEWPELKQTKVQQESNSFSFGAPTQANVETEDKQQSMISSIFGNK